MRTVRQQDSAIPLVQISISEDRDVQVVPSLQAPTRIFKAWFLRCKCLRTRIQHGRRALTWNLSDRSVFTSSSPTRDECTCPTCNAASSGAVGRQELSTSAVPANSRGCMSAPNVVPCTCNHRTSSGAHHAHDVVAAAVGVDERKAHSGRRRSRRRLHLQEPAARHPSASG